MKRGELMESKDNAQDIILSQWQTCVEMANAVSDRRDSMNNLFVTVNLALVAAVSLVWDVKIAVLLVAGVVDCIIWMLFIRNYGNLNSAKFSVITELEKKLPTKPFTDEWQKVKEKKYRRNSKLELVMPSAFIVLYVVLFILVICKK